MAGRKKAATTNVAKDVDPEVRLNLASAYYMKTQQLAEIDERYKQETADLKASIADLESRLIKASFEHLVEGTNTLDIGQGATVKVVQPMSYKFNGDPDTDQGWERYEQAVDLLPASADGVFNVSTSVKIDKKQYKALSVAAKKKLSDYVTVEPGNASLSLVISEAE